MHGGNVGHFREYHKAVLEQPDSHNAEIQFRWAFRLMFRPKFYFDFVRALGYVSYMAKQFSLAVQWNIWTCQTL